MLLFTHGCRRRAMLSSLTTLVRLCCRRGHTVVFHKHPLIFIHAHLATVKFQIHRACMCRYCILLQGSFKKKHNRHRVIVLLKGSVLFLNLEINKIELRYMYSLQLVKFIMAYNRIWDMWSFVCIFSVPRRASALAA